MSRRKPLPEWCTGNYDCPVEGHIVWRGGGHWRRERGHIDLTPGQRKTLAERRKIVAGKLAILAALKAPQSTEQELEA